MRSVLAIPSHSCKINFNIVLSTTFRNSNVFFLQTFPIRILRAYLFCPIHATCLPTRFSCVWLPSWRWVNRTNYAIFPILFSLHPPLAQISSFFMCQCGQRVRSIASRCLRFPKILILKVGINPLFQTPEESIHVSPSKLLIQHILRYPAHLEAVVTFSNLKTIHAVLLPTYRHLPY